VVLGEDLDQQGAHAEHDDWHGRYGRSKRPAGILARRRNSSGRGAYNHPVRVMCVRRRQRTIRQVNTQTASLGALIFISIVPTVLLAGWLIVIFRVARDYDRRD
jgi:hypothetical protein